MMAMLMVMAPQMPLICLQCLARGAPARKGAAHLKRSFAELRKLNLAQLGDFVVELQFHAAVDEREAHAQRVALANRFRRS